MAPAEALRKGWCPGALRPMAAKDGLLVRLRLTGGIVAPETAMAIADLAARFGNGRLDLSSRGNLQLRGVSEAGWPALVAELQTLGLVDDDPAAEAVRNVIASPLAGLHDGLDIRPLTGALEAELTSNRDLHALPSKFGVLIDDGGPLSLGAVSADIRFDWMPEATAFSIGLGGTRAGALRIGLCEPADVVVWLRRIGAGVLALSAKQPPRRLIRLVQDLDGSLVAAACGGASSDTLRASTDSHASGLAGLHQVEHRCVLGLAAPFGRLDHTMLRLAARLVEPQSNGHVPLPPMGRGQGWGFSPFFTAGQGAGGENPHPLPPPRKGEGMRLMPHPEAAQRSLRLTPWRTILLPDVDPRPADLATLQAAGFILDPADPRLGVVACVGQSGCERGTTSTHADATLLAAIAQAAKIPVHVSGCEKGCANAAPAPVTLVGRDGLYDLVRDGRAGDPPALRGLDLAAAQAAIAEGRAA